MERDTIDNSGKYCGWMFSDANRLVGCTKCGETAGNNCRIPSGRKRMTPHTERVIAVKNMAEAEGLGLSPWQRSPKP